MKSNELFKFGYNCAQSVFCAHCEKLGLDFETGLKLSSSFGGGMGRLREVCGAVTAMFMLLGLKNGYTSHDNDIVKEQHYANIQYLANEFEKKFGSIICRDLLNLQEKHSCPAPEKRNEQYYSKRPCEQFVEFASNLISRKLG